MSVKVAVEVIMKRYLQVTFEEVLERRYVRLVIDIKCVSQVKAPVKTE